MGIEYDYINGGYKDSYTGKPVTAGEGGSYYFSDGSRYDPEANKPYELTRSDMINQNYWGSSSGMTPEAFASISYLWGPYADKFSVNDYESAINRAFDANQNNWWNLSRQEQYGLTAQELALGLGLDKDAILDASTADAGNGMTLKQQLYGGANSIKNYESNLRASQNANSGDEFGTVLTLAALAAGGYGLLGGLGEGAAIAGDVGAFGTGAGTDAMGLYMGSGSEMAGALDAYAAASGAGAAAGSDAVGGSSLFDQGITGNGFNPINTQSVPSDLSLTFDPNTGSLTNTTDLLSNVNNQLGTIPGVDPYGFTNGFSNIPAGEGVTTQGAGEGDGTFSNGESNAPKETASPNPIDPKKLADAVKAITGLLGSSGQASGGLLGGGSGSNGYSANIQPDYGLLSLQKPQYANIFQPGQLSPIYGQRG